MYVSKSVAAALDPGRSKIARKALTGIVARLNRFVEGERLTVSTPRIGDGKGEVKALNQKDRKVFAMRFYDVDPQRRLVGVFIKKDVFVGFEMYDRSKIDWPAACRKVQNSINAMGLDAPSCLTYEEMDEVLSNWVESK
ncbi:MAG: hypothetical protein R3D56_12385 [Paracoccaceae bacterium]